MNKEEERKLAAILSADAEGFSRLMGDDESATVETLTRYRDGMGALIEQHNGRLVDSPGDNLLADFTSAVNAVNCGVKIQERLKRFNTELPENRRMLFRIGINLGDVIERDGRIYGDGVNIAARLEGLADAGGICISRQVYDQVKNKLPLEFEYIGERDVKNISEPVRVYCVVMERTAVYGQEPVAKRKISIGPDDALSLKAQKHILRFTPDDFGKAASYLEQSIQSSQGNSWAHGALACVGLYLVRLRHRSSSCDPTGRSSRQNEGGREKRDPVKSWSNLIRIGEKMNQRVYLFVAVLCLILCMGRPRAEKLYEYKDEDGVMHYSNIAPDTDRPVDVKQVRVSGVEERLHVENIGTEREPILNVSNDYGGPVELEFFLLESKNISSLPQLPVRVVVPAESEIEAVRMWPTQEDAAFSYSYSYRHGIGDPSAEHRPSRPYRPPFQAGNTFLISQAFHGTYSHNSPQSEYAIDIAMPPGTPVCAAREGVIMDIANDFFTGGTDREEYSRRANFIRISHDDGTMALYAHLEVESILVGIGTRVVAGEIIARSGDTGFSSGPHLHFAVQKNTDLKLESLPFKILNADGNGVTPKQKMQLRAD